MSDLSERNDLLVVSKTEELACNRLYYRYHQPLGNHVLLITNSVEIVRRSTWMCFITYS